MVPLQKAPGKLGMCYWNVDAAQKTVRGSEIVFGWLVSIWPGLLIECLHHAVLRLPNGKMLDVTEYQYGAVPKVSFVASSELQPSLEWPDHFEPKFYRISADPVVQRYVQVHFAQVSIRRQITERMRAVGAKFVPYEGFAVPEGFDDPLLNSLVKDLDQSRRDFDAAYDALVAFG